ncbi:MAG: hypothetical protein HQL25_06200 [Candidatus Omnitrophica bacterium]|nr:hypothetical protein [Candidatus Omnitrophota bacterium]
MFKRLINLIFVTAFLINNLLAGTGYAQMRLSALAPMINSVPVPLIKGLRVDPQQPFKFEFVVDPNGSTNKNDIQLLIKYFLAGLTIPEKDLWVNLSPKEPDRIIPEAFSQTDMGKGLLEQDFILKQMTSAMILPNNKLGKEFWEKIYEKAYETRGKEGKDSLSSLWGEGKGEGILNKVWIIPDKAVVYEGNNTAYVVEAKLKVMTEEDYLAGGSPVKSLRDHGVLNYQTFLKNIIIPKIEAEVNEGPQFAQLRQIYHSLILAMWFKKNLQNHIINKGYSDRNKVDGINNNDPQAKQKIYDAYLKAFTDGANALIKEDYDPNTQQIVPRKYISGGLDYTHFDSAMTVTQDKAMVPAEQGLVLVKSGILSSDSKIEETDAAMKVQTILDQQKKAGLYVWSDDISRKGAPNGEINDFDPFFVKKYDFIDFIMTPLSNKEDILKRQTAVKVFLGLPEEKRRKLSRTINDTLRWFEAYQFFGQYTSDEDEVFSQDERIPLLLQRKKKIGKDYLQKIAEYEKKEGSDWYLRQINYGDLERDAHAMFKRILTLDSAFERFFDEIREIGDPLLTQLAEDISAILKKTKMPSIEEILEIAKRGDEKALDKIFNKVQDSEEIFGQMMMFINFADMVKEMHFQEATYDDEKPAGYKNGWMFTDSRDKQVVNNSPEDIPVAVYTGSQMAGKSYQLKQNFFIQLLGQSMGFVPAENANIRIYQSLAFLDRPRTQALYDLSAFQVEIRNLLPVDRNKKHPLLLFMDEGYSTTSPNEQTRFLIGTQKFVESFQGRMRVATHNEEYIQWAEIQPLTRIYHPEVILKPDGKPDYKRKILPGSGDSLAITVARSEGLQKEILSRVERYHEQNGQLEPVADIKKTINPLTQYSEEERAILKQRSESFTGFLPLDNELVIDDQGHGGKNTLRWKDPKHSSRESSLSRFFDLDEKRVAAAYPPNGIFYPYSKDKHWSDGQLQEGMSTIISRMLKMGATSDPKELLERQKMFELLSSSKIDNLFSQTKFLHGLMLVLLKLEDFDAGAVNFALLNYPEAEQMCFHKENGMFYRGEHLIESGMRQFLQIAKAVMSFSKYKEDAMGLTGYLDTIEELMTLDRDREILYAQISEAYNEAVEEISKDLDWKKNPDRAHEIYQKFKEDYNIDIQVRKKTEVVENRINELILQISSLHRNEQDSLAALEWSGLRVLSLRGDDLLIRATQYRANDDSLSQEIAFAVKTNLKQFISEYLRIAMPVSILDADSSLREKIFQLLNPAASLIAADLMNEAGLSMSLKLVSMPPIAVKSVFINFLVDDKGPLQRLLDEMRSYDSVPLHQMSNYFEQLFRYYFNGKIKGSDYLEDIKENYDRYKEIQNTIEQLNTVVSVLNDREVDKKEVMGQLRDLISNLRPKHQNFEVVFELIDRIAAGAIAWDGNLDVILGDLDSQHKGKRVGAMNIGELLSKVVPLKYEELSVQLSAIAWNRSFLDSGKIDEEEKIAEELSKWESILEFAKMIRSEQWAKVEFTNESVMEARNAWNVAKKKAEQSGDRRLNFRIDERERVRIYASTNGSGKTFALKTQIWLALAAQVTGFAPCDFMRSQIFSGIFYIDRPGSDGYEITLSAFGRDMKNWKDYLSRRANIHGPVLTAIDEIASTTSPTYQEAFAYGFSEDHLERGDFLSIATHNEQFVDAFSRINGRHTGVYHFETEITPEGAVNYHYKVEPGMEPSNALAVAKAQGLKRIANFVEKIPLKDAGDKAQVSSINGGIDLQNTSAQLQQFGNPANWSMSDIEKNFAAWPGVKSVIFSIIPLNDLNGFLAGIPVI